MTTRRCTFWGALGLVFAAAAENTNALTFNVNQQEDDNGLCEVQACALREAILAANASPGLDTIMVPAGLYQLADLEVVDELTGDLEIRDDVVINGSEVLPTTIVAPRGDGVITIVSSAVTLRNLRITGGLVGSLPSGGSGGGIAAWDSQVTLSNSAVYNNVAIDDGGGIVSVDSSFLITNSTVSGNAADFGGGIARVAGPGTIGADLTLINSTISGNSSSLGSGIFSFGPGVVTVVNSTITSENAYRPSDVIYLSNAQDGIAFSNVLIKGECYFSSSPTPTSNGGNIESPGATCYLPHPTDRMNVPDLRLGPLADNGGPTLTHALWADSPAIDSADSASCPADDQRGTARPQDGDRDGTASCDVGAFELLPVPAAVEVPTLGAVGMIVLVLLLGVVAVTVTRRRRFTEPLSQESVDLRSLKE